ncbi:MAG TPA: HK97 gp10 family phage protein, partial [Phycisphaerae bacterium]|nr:HK97 gp10 family phage protein [Phycisphaerae bacterium]
SMERKIALEGLRRLVMKTPVDTGRARGGWQVSIGRPPAGQADRKDRAGDATILAGSGVIDEIKTPVKCVLGNNVEYIEKLEHGGSKQAPNGMLGLTVDELSAMFT